MQGRLFWGTLVFTLIICLSTWAAAAFACDIPHSTAFILGCLPCIILAICLCFWSNVALVVPAMEIGEHIKRFGKEKDFLPSAAVDEFVEMHETLSKFNESYREEHALARGMRETLPMPYLLVNTKEQAISTNQACLDMLEIDGKPKDCLGKTLAELFYNDRFRSTAVGKAMNEGQIFANLEVTINGHKGRETNVIANVFPVKDDAGKSVAGLCIYADVTAMSKRAAELEKSVGDLKKELEKTKQRENPVLKPKFGTRSKQG